MKGAAVEPKHKEMARQMRADGVSEEMIARFVAEEMEEDEFRRGKGVTAEHIVAHSGHILRRENQPRAVLVNLRIFKQQNHVPQEFRVQFGVKLVNHHSAAALP